MVSGPYLEEKDERISVVHFLVSSNYFLVPTSLTLGQDDVSTRLPLSFSHFIRYVLGGIVIDFYR